MKTIRLFSVALAMLFAMGANAQIFKDGHFVGNFNIGGVTGKGGFSKAAFGIGLGYQTRELYSCDYVSLAWDVFQFEWNAPFDSPGDLDFLGFKTGARAFSPSFAKDKLRGYTNLAMGYTLGLWSFGSDTQAESAFGLTWGIGLQYSQKWSLGYTLEYESNGTSKCHFATVAYTF